MRLIQRGRSVDREEARTAGGFHCGPSRRNAMIDGVATARHVVPRAVELVVGLPPRAGESSCHGARVWWPGCDWSTHDGWMPSIWASREGARRCLTSDRNRRAERQSPDPGGIAVGELSQGGRAGAPVGRRGSPRRCVRRLAASWNAGTRDAGPGQSRPAHAFSQLGTRSRGGRVRDRHRCRSRLHPHGRPPAGRCLPSDGSSG